MTAYSGVRCTSACSKRCTRSGRRRYSMTTEEGGAVRPAFAPAPGFGGRVRILARDLADSMRQREAVVIVSVTVQ